MLLYYRHQRAGGSMLPGSVVVASVAVSGFLMMATVASVSAQQIGNSQAQPSNVAAEPGDRETNPRQSNSSRYCVQWCLC